MDKKGVSLIVLVLSIMIILILSTTVTIVGQDAYKSIEYIQFTKKIDVIEKAVKKAAIKGKTEGVTLNDYIEDVNVRSNYETTLDELNTIIQHIEQKYQIQLNLNKYYLINGTNLESLGVKNIKGEFIINYDNGIAFSIVPLIML